jgi:hypothetical protein
MNKQIIFSLLLITKISIHGMDTSNKNLDLHLYNPNLLPHITKRLCIDYHHNPLQIKKDIRALSLTNKVLHDYYNTEKIAQHIIRLCSLNRNSNDESIAGELGCGTIKEKIGYFSSIVRDKKRNFTPEDLQYDWYLNCTTNCINQSLLYIAIDHLNLEKAELIIKHSKKLNFRYGVNQNLLLCINRHTQPNKCFISKNGNNDRKKLLNIAQSLLQKKINPNVNAHGITPLIRAIFHDNKPFTQLLLQYGANPYIKQYDPFTYKYVNAFEVEHSEPKGWLLTMFNYVKEVHFKCWILKNYTLLFNPFPHELMCLITQLLNTHIQV